MYVIEVMPLGRGQHLEALSYFSATAYPYGTLLSIPVRSQTLSGVVLSAHEVSGARAALRSATFSLRRLPAQTEVRMLPRALIETADELADRYAAQSGAVLFALLPSEVRSGALALPPEAERRSGEHLHEVLTAPRTERIQAYQSIVREAFASDRSVTLVVPTTEDGAALHEVLQAGIEQYVVPLYRARGIRAQRAAYARLAEGGHPTLTIATPHHAFLDRPDTGVVIVERSRSFAYRHRARPYLDYRDALRTYARTTGMRFLSGDTLVRTEDEYLIRGERALPHGEHPKRIALSGTLKPVPMEDAADGVTPFKLFSETVYTAIEKTRRSGGRTFLFSARRGLAPIVACADCGHILRCPQSGSPLALHRVIKDGIEERRLVSSVSGYTRRADDHCEACGSWRLRERGIGVQHVYDELAERFPADDLILFDHQTASTHAKATALRDTFYTKKKAIMVGTALALPYLRAPIETSVVVSLDSLRAIPSWRQEEEALGTLLSLREATAGTVYVQMRAPDEKLIEHARTGATAAYYDEELPLRERFAYPPYAVLIHLTWKKRSVSAEQVAEHFAGSDIHIYDAPGAEDTTAYGLIRVAHDAWPDATLAERIRALPPSVRVVLNPDRLV